jgi:hypothetical protein
MARIEEASLMSHTATQERFFKALFDPSALVPANLAGNAKGRPERRFAVYRNNVVTGLIHALMARFPAVVAIVGEEFFAGMARRFAALCPPSSPILAQYGDAFPEFVETFAPAASMPYLADVARLEIARTQAFHAADARTASASDLQQLDAERLDRTEVELHPAMRLLRSRHPVVTIWAMNAGEIDPAPIETWAEENALVTRPAFAVHVHRLTRGQFAFLSALRSRNALMGAIEAASAESPEFDAASAIADLVARGIAVSFKQ